MLALQAWCESPAPTNGKVEIDMRLLAGLLTMAFASVAGTMCLFLIAIWLFGIPPLRYDPVILDGVVGAFLLCVLFGLLIATPTALLVLPVLSLIEEDGEDLLPAGGALGGAVTVAPLIAWFLVDWSHPRFVVPLLLVLLGAGMGWMAGHFFAAVLRTLQRGAQRRTRETHKPD